MPNLSRFDCPTARVVLSVLLRRGRSVLGVALASALILHVSLAGWRGSPEQQRTVKPLSTQFVKREPRLTKPLELKKRPQPRRRQMQRKMVSVKPRADNVASTSSFDRFRSLQNLARPTVRIGRASELMATAIEPEMVMSTIEATKQPEEKLGMPLEMLSVDALDTGQYHAVVIQDPHDKQNIRGFFHLAVVYSKSAGEVSQASSGTYYPDMMAIPNLVRFINQNTQIRTDIVAAIPLDHWQLFEVPWVFLTTWGRFHLSNTEAEYFGKYLTIGGFALSDDCLNQKGSVTDICLRTAIKDALATQGLRYNTYWTFLRIPDDHPLLHCYYDLSNPPIGAVNTSLGHVHEDLEGVTLSNRLVVVHTTNDYGCAWNRWRDRDYPSALRFGVNLIVFALTQEGSITRRLAAALY